MAKSTFFSVQLTPLQRNMQLAAHAMEQTYLRLPIGGLNRDDVRARCDEDEMAGQFEYFNVARNSLERYYHEKTLGKFGHPALKKADFDRAIKLMKGGYCAEYAVCACEYLIKRNPLIEQKLEFVIFNNQHQAVVIGRAPDSKPEDPSTWGDEAVVLDAWARKVYPASMLIDVEDNFDNIFYTLANNNNELVEQQSRHYLAGPIECISLSDIGYYNEGKSDYGFACYSKI